MRELAQEEADLGLADRHIMEGEERVTRQIRMIAVLRSRGHSDAVAQQLLTTLEQTLGSWQEHRRLILNHIAALKLRASDPVIGTKPL